MIDLFIGSAAVAIFCAWLILFVIGCATFSWPWHHQGYIEKAGTIILFISIICGFVAVLFAVIPDITDIGVQIRETL